MIDTADLQTFLANLEGGEVAVDLLKIGQGVHPATGGAGGNKNKFNNGKFRLALDMEDCLDRFYGGYYSDWACGGQWNRAYQFVQLLANAFNVAHVEVIAFFDGTLKEHKKQSFERNQFRQKTISVLKHIRMIGTPPPKIWWLPPSGIRTCLRNAMRNLSIQVVQTVNDHTMEVIDYFHEHSMNGILGLHPDYIVANTARYFSSHDLRLSYKGSLETKEFLVSKLLSSLSLTPDHLPFVAVFLGGYILIDEPTLKRIYIKIKIDETCLELRIKRLAEIVRNSPTNDLDAFIKHLDLAEWSVPIKESIEYYQRKGKFAGKSYLNHRKQAKQLQQQQQQQQLTQTAAVKLESAKEIAAKDTPATITQLASETSEDDELARMLLESTILKGDQDCVLVEGPSSTAVVAVPSSSTSATKDSKKDIAATKTAAVQKSNKSAKLPVFVYTLPGEVIKTSLNRHQRGIMDPKIYQLLTRKEIVLPQILEDEQNRKVPSIHVFYRPARQMIYAILFNMYHQKYLCSKRDKDQQLPKMPDITVSEWIWSPQNEYRKAELVTATLLPWAVPTIQRLWFGTIFDDKQRRMRAFLSVMRSDSPLMLNRGYVPQHMLALACVLRYIVTNPDRNILTRQELDAFLATAFSPHIINIEYTQELVLPGVHLRGVFLATLLMQGVETASLANDACGVPLPWTMTNPWLFFDGKLFHLKLKMSTYVQSLRELCDDHIEIVLKIERFRKAILEDVEHLLLPAHIDPMYHRANFMPSVNLPQGYGKNTIHPIGNIPLVMHHGGGPPPPQSYYANAGGNNIRGSNRGRRGTNIQQQLVRQIGQRQNGYQLKVGGVVVGSWAGGVPQKPIGSGGGGANIRYARAGVVNVRRRAGPLTPNPIRHHRTHPTILGNPSVSRTISRNTYGVAKVSKNRTRKNRLKEKKPTAVVVAAVAAAVVAAVTESSADEEAIANNKVILKVKKSDAEEKQSNGEKPTETMNTDNTRLSNGSTVVTATKSDESKLETPLGENKPSTPSSAPSTPVVETNSTVAPVDAIKSADFNAVAADDATAAHQTNGIGVTTATTAPNQATAITKNKKTKKGKAATASTTDATNTIATTVVVDHESITPATPVSDDRVVAVVPTADVAVKVF